jgi:hypothetical protein
MQRAGDVPLVKQLAPPFMARALRTPPRKIRHPHDLPWRVGSKQPSHRCRSAWWMIWRAGQDKDENWCVTVKFRQDIVK